MFPVCLALLLRSPASAAEARPDEAVLRFFDTVVFGSELADGAETKIVRKWIAPVRYRLAGKPAAVHRLRPLVERHAATLSRITGLENAEAPAGGPPTW